MGFRIIKDGNQIQRYDLTQDANPSIEGQSYLYVAGNGTATENGAELVAAYNAAKLMTPYGNALSDTNRVSVLAGPGLYTPPSKLLVNTDFINILSLDSNRSIALTNGINVTADNVHIRGVDVGTSTFEGCTQAGILIENCSGGINSFGNYGGTASGTFINCTAGDDSFGGGFQGTASGTFINCTAGINSFGGGFESTASGTFTNCTTGNISFGGGYQGIASGTFTNCTAGNDSFGGGYESTASGTFTNCTGGGGSFGGGDLGGTASGTFVDCTSGIYSFGGGESGDGTLSGFVLYSRLTSGTFIAPSAGGKVRLSLDSALTEINLG
jgi:hypothetical protein